MTINKTKFPKVLFRNWKIACRKCQTVNLNKGLTCRNCGAATIKARVWRKVEAFLTRGHTEVSLICVACQNDRVKVTCETCDTPLRGQIAEHFARKWLL